MTELPKPPPGPSPGVAEPQFAFHMRAVEMDQSGYYYVRWDRATPLIVHAATRAEAFEKCWTVMGDCPRGRGWTWTAKVDKITEVER